MSCLYLSPEVTSLGLLSIELGRGSRLERYVSYASDSSAAQFRTDCRKSRSTKTRPLQSSGSRCCINSFRLPNQAQVSRVIFQAQYQAFVRSAVRSSAAL